MWTQSMTPSFSKATLSPQPQDSTNKLEYVIECVLNMPGVKIEDYLNKSWANLLSSLPGLNA